MNSLLCYVIINKEFQGEKGVFCLNTYILQSNNKYFGLNSKQNKIDVNKDLFKLQKQYLNKALFNFYNKQISQYLKLYKPLYKQILRKIDQRDKMLKQYPTLKKREGLQIPKTIVAFNHLVVSATQLVIQITKLRLHENPFDQTIVHTHQLMLQVANRADAQVEQIPNFKFTLFFSVLSNLNSNKDSKLLRKYLQEIYLTLSSEPKRTEFIYDLVQNTQLTAAQKQALLKDNDFNNYLIKHTGWQQINKNKVTDKMIKIIL